MLADRMELPSVVAELRCSRIVVERLSQKNVSLTRSRVGRLYMTQAMHATGAALGGELSGHFYWHSFGGMECPELTFLTVIRLVRDSGVSLAQLIKPYQKYYRSEEINIPLRDLKEASHIRQLLERRFSGCPMDRTDGLSLDCGDYWFNLRPSNTEALLRLVVESKRKDLLERHIQEIRGLLH